jgi:hypothetical protein
MKMKNNIICMKKSISNFVENFLLSIILDFENFPDTVCTIRIWKMKKIKWLINININYIRKFFVIEMLMLMTMTVEVEVVNAVQVYKNGLKNKYKII